VAVDTQQAVAVDTQQAVAVDTQQAAAVDTQQAVAHAIVTDAEYDNTAAAAHAAAVALAFLNEPYTRPSLC